VEITRKVIGAIHAENGRFLRKLGSNSYSCALRRGERGREQALEDHNHHPPQHVLAMKNRAAVPGADHHGAKKECGHAGEAVVPPAAEDKETISSAAFGEEAGDKNRDGGNHGCSGIDNAATNAALLSAFSRQSSGGSSSNNHCADDEDEEDDTSVSRACAADEDNDGNDACPSYVVLVDMKMLLLKTKLAFQHCIRRSKETGVAFSSPPHGKRKAAVAAAAASCETPTRIVKKQRSGERISSKCEEIMARNGKNNADGKEKRWRKSGTGIVRLSSEGSLNINLFSQKESRSVAAAAAATPAPVPFLQDGDHKKSCSDEEKNGHGDDDESSSTGEDEESQSSRKHEDDDGDAKKIPAVRSAPMQQVGGGARRILEEEESSFRHVVLRNEDLPRTITSRSDHVVDSTQIPNHGGDDGAARKLDGEDDSGSGHARVEARSRQPSLLPLPRARHLSNAQENGDVLANQHHQESLLRQIVEQRSPIALDPATAVLSRLPVRPEDTSLLLAGEGGAAAAGPASPRRTGLASLLLSQIAQNHGGQTTTQHGGSATAFNHAQLLIAESIRLVREDDRRRAEHRAQQEEETRRRTQQLQIFAASLLQQGPQPHLFPGIRADTNFFSTSPPPSNGVEDVMGDYYTRLLSHVLASSSSQQARQQNRSLCGGGIVHQESAPPQPVFLEPSLLSGPAVSPLPPSSSSPSSLLLPWTRAAEILGRRARSSDPLLNLCADAVARCQEQQQPPPPSSQRPPRPPPS